MRTEEEILAEMNRVGRRDLTKPELWNWFMALAWALGDGEEVQKKVSELLNKYCR